MKNEQKTKKGIFEMLRESFNKTGGCNCGPGETCGGTTEESEKVKAGETPKSKTVSKSAKQ